MSTVKVVKLLGTSEESWQQAAEEAVEEANETIDDLTGVAVESWTADIENGEVSQYKATVEVAFPVHSDREQNH
ncbi:dodecin family protein [Haloferax namakaokahaiae]|uniref:Dodecin family protein n=1 Tax=Haloferax namakaokahaiae TaxID=1748331 RepID=A0ABD5ZDQ6_9EURY